MTSIKFPTNKEKEKGEERDEDQAFPRKIEEMGEDKLQERRVALTRKDPTLRDLILRSHHKVHN